MLVTREKAFYQTFFRLFSAIVVQNVIVLGVNLADNVMIGRWSESALAGVAAVNQIQFLLQCAMSGTADALVTLGSQYWGQKRTGPVKQVGKAALLIGCGVALLFLLLTTLFPVACVRLFTDTDAIVAEGVIYLRIVRWSYLFFAATTILLALLRTVEVVRIALWLSLTTLVVNISLNYVLIYGHFGFPAMGSAGAAYATLAARVAEFVLLLIYLIFMSVCRVI